MKRIALVLSIMFGIVCGAITYEKTVKSYDEFMREVGKFPRAVVIFYTSKFASKYERKAFEKDFKKARRDFDAVSRQTRYKDAGLAFLRVDLDKQANAELADRYALTQVPVYMLFSDGSPLQTAQGITVQRSKFLQKHELETFIERHYGKEINNVLQEIYRLRQREREERINSNWSPYFYWGYGGGYPYGFPYYYYPPYGGRAGFGFYIGG